MCSGPLEARALAIAQEIHLLDRGDDLREQDLAEQDLALVVEGDVHAPLRRQPHLLPHLLEQEPVAHEPRRLVDEVLALGLHLLRLVAVVVAQRQDAERDVARLVAHDVRREITEERLLRVHADHAERRQREALDHDLHAEELHVPARVLEHHVEERAQVRVARVREADLLVQVAVVDVDVARLVDDLGRAVELGVEVVHRIDELRGREQRALLAVEELRQRPRRRLDVELPLLALRHPRVDVGAEERQEVLGAHRLLEVRLAMPRQDVLGDPLSALRLLVEVAQLLARLGVAPRVRHVEDGLERVDRRTRGVDGGRDRGHGSSQK